ncbi:MAG: hypothetical protein H6592_03025 [Flavobacteriales bacterium]|nr:hypothetical protein [Flavobacteriales bacterium]
MQLSPPERILLTQVSFVATLYYGLLHAIMNYAVSDGVVFATWDSREYLDVGRWLLGGPESQGTAVRAYLYPLGIALMHKAFGAYGIWAMQFFGWLICIGCTHLATRRATRRPLLAWITSSIVMFNLSLFAMTYHALTEVWTSATLAVLALFIVTTARDWGSARFYIAVAGITVPLALLKPVFFPLLISWVFIMGPLLYWRALGSKISRYRALMCVLLPLAPQFAIMAYKHHRIGFSDIGNKTFRNYLFARCFADLNDLTFDMAIDTVSKMTDTQVNAVLRNHPKTFLKQYLTHLEDNVYYAGGYTLELAPNHDHPTAVWLMDRMNKLYCILHFLYIIPCFVICFRLHRHKAYDRLCIILILMAFTYLLLFSNGISFWQGDRLILPTICTWPLLYAMVSAYLLKKNNTFDEQIITLE